MEMERINDDTILVRIENEDLQERGTSVSELLANPTEIEEFFHSILVEMDVIDQFEDSEGMLKKKILKQIANVSFEI